MYKSTNIHVNNAYSTICCRITPLVLNKAGNKLGCVRSRLRTSSHVSYRVATIQPALQNNVYKQFRLVICDDSGLIALTSLFINILASYVDLFINVANGLKYIIYNKQQSPSICFAQSHILQVVVQTHSKLSPKMVSFYAPLITLSFALSSLAATCSNGNSGCSVAQFWQAREIACNTRQFGVVDCGNGWTVNAGLQLSVNESQDQAYEHCWVRQP